MKKLYFLIFLLFSLFYFSQNKIQKDISYNFYENKGQIIDQKGKQNEDVKFLYIANGLNVQLKKSGFSYDVYETERKEVSESKKPIESISKNEAPKYKITQKFHRVDIAFVNSNPKVEIVAADKSPDYDNYYNIPNLPNGVENVHRYRKVTYKNLYPNIDLEFFKPNDTLKPVEYNFIVKPGGKISTIQLKFNGAKTHLKDGKLSMNLRFGEMQENIPNSWIEDLTSKKDIKINFKETGDQIFGFESSQDVFDKTVVIDPTPTRIWGSYLGGFREDYGQLKTDKNNNVFIYGLTQSTNNIATSGTYQSSLNGNYDAFLNKISKDGLRFWGTYYGNVFTDEFSGVDFDENDNIYLSANTEIPSVTLPTNPYYVQPQLAILKLKSDGTLIYGRVFGGNSFDQSRDLYYKNNQVFIAGETRSDKDFATSGAFQENFGYEGYDCGFLGNFDASNGNTKWITYVGGDGPTSLWYLFSYDNGIELLGNTRAHNIPMLNAFQPTRYSTAQNFLASGLYMKFGDDGKLLKSSYIGDNSLYYDSARRIGNNLIFGTLLFALEANFYIVDSTTNTIKDIKKIALPSNFQSGTYTDAQNNYYITGLGLIDNPNISSITTPNSYKPNIGSYDSSFYIKYNSNLEKMWGTFFAGDGGTQLAHIYQDYEGYLYFTGMSSNNHTGIATPGTFQQTGGHPSNDIYIEKFADCTSNVNFGFTPTCINNDLKLTASGGDTYEWFGPNGFHSFLQNPIIPNAKISDSGEYFVRMTGAQTCGGIFTLNIKIGSPSPPVFDNQNLPNLTGTCTIKLTAPTETDGCGNKTIATTKFPLSNLSPGDYIIVWDYDDGNGNISHQNQNITISSPALPTANATQEFCSTENRTIADLRITGQNIIWYDESGTVLDQTSKLVNGNYYASQNTNGCESNKIKIFVKINVTPLPLGEENQDFCSSQNAKISDLKVTGNTLKFYDSAGNILPNSTLLKDAASYFVTQSINSCESEKLEIKVVISQNALPANNYSLSICNDTTSNRKIEDLTKYQDNLITNSSTYIFEYFDQNQVSITDFKNRTLSIGQNVFNIKVSTNLGCFKIVQLTLQLNEKPEVNLPETAEFCTGKSVELDAGFNPNYTYEWSSGEKTNKISVNKEGTYTLKVTTNFGCENTASTVVKKSLIAEILSVDITNNNAKIILSASGDFEYSLDNKNWQDSNEFKNLTNGNYTVYVRTKLGCIIGEKDFTIFNISNSFSPNGDGKNDIWKVDGLENYPNSEVSVYDNQGKRVLFKITSGAFEWDGKLNSRNLPTATYWYNIKVSDGRILNGYLLLKNRN